MDIRQLTDIHTHHRNRPDALLSLEPHELPFSHDRMLPDTPFSISLHPWHLTGDTVARFHDIIGMCKDNQMLMGIGECGLDNKCGTPLSLQTEAFLVSLHTARQLRLPMIIHCVGYWAEMQKCVRQEWGAEGANTALREGTPLIVHGFRKGPDLCRQLLAAGFCISLGAKYNKDCLGIIPADRLFRETDND